MIDRLLQPLLSLHGWQAYLLVGLLVFAEAAVMLGFVFPGETAASSVASWPPRAGWT